MSTTNYENAPATKLLATHCGCCGRALVDAVSVERGVGPDCAEKYGAPEAQGEPNWHAVLGFLGVMAERLGIAGASGPRVSPREAANNLVYFVARPAKELTHAEVVAAIAAIGALGFVVLAERITRRFRIRAAQLPAPGPSVEELRAEYARVRAELAYDNMTKAEVDAAARAIAIHQLGGETPENFVAALERITCPCRRCGGTGRFVVGTENGAPKFGGGDCFRCGGNGYQDLGDARRNKAYDAHAMSRALRAS